MKKFIIVVFSLILVFSLCGCSETDSSKFKKEYESLNNKKTDDGKHNYRNVSINKNNKIKYATASDIVDKMKNKESFVVYFGFNKCPWSRSLLEELLRASEDSSISTIYYVDISDLRDVKEYKDGKVVTTKSGDKSYMKLLKLMDDVLDDYIITDGEKDVSTGEKRIYTPNVVGVVKGKADKKTDGVSPKFKDPYMKLNDSIKNYAYKNFKCVMTCVADSKNVCTKDSKC